MLQVQLLNCSTAALLFLKIGDCSLNTDARRNRDYNLKAYLMVAVAGAA
jgi:hypothetical protein